MQEVFSGIEIKASPAKVWEVLMDFTKYPYWNPFITAVEGEAQEGGTLDVEMELSNKETTFRPRVLEIIPYERLRWLARWLIPGLFDSEHSFEIHQLESGNTLFVQHERFSGILVPFFGRILESTRQGFEEMNEALKRMSEHLAKNPDQG